MSEFARNFNQNIDELVDSVAGQIHIADKINDLVLSKEFLASDAPMALYEILVKKWGYAVLSVNLINSVDSETFFAEVSKWKVCEIVLLYHHPDLGAICINPKNPEHKEYIADFRKNELVVIYAGYKVKKAADDICRNVVAKIGDLLLGKKIKTTEDFLKGSYTYKKVKAVEKAPVKVTKSVTKKSVESSGGSFSFGSSSKGDQVKKPTVAISPTSLRKMTPMVSVPVTNELFHNGNVEAWKRIIASYQNKYPKLQIFVYYDGERIADINALFKWGKVKHGSSIQFVVAGDDIKDVAKLKRYFAQGASPMFEAFLQGAPGTILPLF